MIVDDEDDLLTAFKKGLEHAGFEIDAISNPLDVIAKFKPCIYDMAILDIHMPQMDGFDLFEQLSKTDNKLLICFLTAFDIDYFEKF